MAFGGKDRSRDALYNATDIVISTYFSVFGRSRVEYQIKRFSDLDGMRIGYKRAARPTRSLLEKLPSAIIKPYDSHESMTQALLSREIDVIVAWMSYDHWRKQKLQGTIDKILLIDEYPMDMVTHIRKDWPEFVSIMNKVIVALQQEELSRILNKWFIDWPQQLAADGLHLTPEEQAWIADNPMIDVGNSPLLPYHFRDEGKDIGYQVEVMEAMFLLVGLTPRYHWSEKLQDSLDGMLRGEVDVAMNLLYTPERDEKFGLSEYRYPRSFGIFTQTDRTDIFDLASLHGKRIAVYKGYALNKKLQRALPDATIIEAEGFEGMLRLVANGKADAFIQEINSGKYSLRRFDINNVEPKGLFEEPDKPTIEAHSYGVRKDMPVLKSILDKAFKALPSSEKQRIWDRWFTSSATLEGSAEQKIDYRQLLSKEERAWLGQGHTVRVRIVDYPPYMVVKETKPPQGIVIAYLKLIEERIGIRFKYEVTDQPFIEFLENIELRRGLDMAAIIVPTPEREQYLSFTKTYLSSPYVIFLREEAETILDISALSGRTIAVPRGHVVQEQLERNYPKLRLALFDSDEEALQALSTGLADAYIGNLTVASHISKMRGFSNLKVAAATPFGDQSFSMGNRNDWPALASIIDKALASISEEEKTAIRNKYLAIKYEQGIDKAEVLKWVLIVGVAVATLFFVFLFWNRRLSREIRIREQAEEDLKLAKDDAEAANRAKSTFLANMSHELRTPLHAILGFSRLLARDSSVKGAQQEKLDIINHSGEHLLGMVDDILSLSKIEAGHIELKQEAFDFIHVLQDVSQMMKSRSEDKGLRFILELDPGLSPYVMGDAGKLRQVLINLLGNAVKFTEKGEVWLRARSQPMSVPDMALFQMEVQDTGPGIPQDRLDDVFESFVRADQTQVIERGTGLGLAISKSLIGMMNGEIAIESEPGQGSLFKVNVPLQLVKAGAAMPSEAPMAEVIGLQEAQPSWRILVVDDNLENRVLLTTLLTRIGCSVKEANNGEQAIKIFQQWRPHFIWMDMRMPVMDGFEATRKIRTSAGGESVRIVAVTASVLEEQHNKMLACGCDEVVRKPFKDNEIFESMARLLDIKYLFKDNGAEAVRKPGVNLTAEMLAELPPDLRQELDETTLALNHEAILEVIEGISEHAPDTAESLRLLVQNFQIERIRELLGEVA